MQHHPWKMIEAEMEKVIHQDEQELPSAWELIMALGRQQRLVDRPEAVCKARREDVEVHPSTPDVHKSSEACLRETGKDPVKTGWAEADKGRPGKPNVRARWVAKEYKTHARPVKYASTPTLEALKVVLSEIVTGEREGEVLAVVDERRA